MWWQLLLVVVGLALFEVVSSVDNAVLNAKLLAGLPPRYRRFFLTWGLLFAVLVFRLGVLLALLMLAGFDFAGITSPAAWQSRAVSEKLAEIRPLLLMFGGMYLHLIFWSWLLTEKKLSRFLAGSFLGKHHFQFYWFVLMFAAIAVYLASLIDLRLGIAGALGCLLFFVIDNLKRVAAWLKQRRHQAIGWSSLIYLESLDAIFAIDGVIGAFAFTMNVPLIILGSGLGAYVVRELTVKGLRWINHLSYLKNAALYSIGFLSLLMIAEGFGVDFKWWFASAASFTVLTITLLLSMLKWRSRYHQ